MYMDEKNIYIYIYISVCKSSQLVVSVVTLGVYHNFIYVLHFNETSDALLKLRILLITHIWRWQISRVAVRAKEAVEAAGGSVRRVYYNKLGFRALLKPEWFEKKGRLLPKAARPPPKQRDKIDSIGRLPAPTKPIPFSVEEKEEASSSSA